MVQFRRHGTAHAARQHGRRQHRPQLTHDTEVDDRAELCFETQLVKLAVRLHCQHHADEGSGNGHDRNTAHADGMQNRQQRAAAQPSPNHPGEGAPAEESYISQAD